MKKQSFHEPSIESDSLETLSRKLLDVTKELASTNADLTAARKNQMDMLANISHDLRAPISAIRSSLDLLRSDIVLDEEERANILQLMDRRTRTLETLVSDLYLLFSLKMNHSTFRFESIDASYFLNEYYLMTKLDKKYDDRDFTLRLPDSDAAVLHIDIQRMILALDNLIGNAYKYTAKGGCIVLAEKFSKTNGTLSIEVADNGIGIPDESIEKVFDYTYTVSKSRTPQQETHVADEDGLADEEGPTDAQDANATSSGLGLSIVKSIVEAHGGSVHCKSRLGTGSIFSIVLPAASGS